MIITWQLFFASCDIQYKTAIWKEAVVIYAGNYLCGRTEEIHDKFQLDVLYEVRKNLVATLVFPVVHLSLCVSVMQHRESSPPFQNAV